MASTANEARGVRALPRLSWGAVIAGVLLALAAHVVLGLIGAALGFAAEPADSAALGAAAAVWALVTPFVATLLGAWLAVRLASQWEEAGSNLHGVMVWCIGLIAGALFLTGTLASGAMTAGTAASGNAAAMQRFTGTTRADAQGQAGEARADRAGKGAAAAAGGAAMAALAGLLGAFAGAAIARRPSEGRGLGFRIAIERSRRGHREDEYARRTAAASPGYGGTYVGPVADEGATPGIRREDAPGGEPPAEPYHH